MQSENVCDLQQLQDCGALPSALPSGPLQPSEMYPCGSKQWRGVADLTIIDTLHREAIQVNILVPWRRYESSRYTNVSPHLQKHVGFILLYFQPPFIFPASNSRTLWQSFRALGQCWSLISAWALLLYTATVGIMERLLHQKVRIHRSVILFFKKQVSGSKRILGIMAPPAGKINILSPTQCLGLEIHLLVMTKESPQVDGLIIELSEESDLE